MKWFTKPLLARDGLEVAFRPCAVPDAFAAECVWDRAPLPLCTLWLRWDDKAEKTTLRILNAYVPETYRRLGLLTWTFEQVATQMWRPRFVVTEKGTEFSEPWLVKTGFKHGKDGWTLTL